MDPLTAGLAGAGLVSGVIQGIFGGSDPVDPNEKKLPYELELAMLDNFNKGIVELDATQKQFEEATSEYKTRLDLIDKGLNNLIPAAELQKELAGSSLRLAQALGQSGEDLVKNGFLTAEDVTAMNELKALEDKSSVDLAQTDASIMRERQILTQRLQRQGITGSALEQALRDFDVKSGETIKNEKFARGTDLIGLRSNLRQQGFNQATGSLGAVQSELGRIQGVYGQKGQLASESYGASGNLAGFRAGMVTTKQGLYDSLGKFNLSGRVQGDLAQGRVGVGGKAATGTPISGVNTSADPNNMYSGTYSRQSNNELWSIAQGARDQKNLNSKSAALEELRSRGAWSEAEAKKRRLL